MITSRRDALKLIGAAPVAAFVGEAIGSIGAMGSAAGGIGSGGAGYYPSGHWIAAKQSMVQIYPQSSGVNTYARHLWAYWDGTNDIEYSVPLGVAFGAYPYVFTLLSGPPGMSIAQPTYSGFQNSNYGRLIWHPQGNISSSGSWTVSVLVTDQQHNTLTLSWTLTTSASASQFIFVDGVAGNDSNSGTIGSPLKTLSGAFGSTFAATANAGALCYVKGGSTYTLPPYSDNDIGGSYSPAFEFHTGRKPAALMQWPGTGTATIDVSGTGQSSLPKGMLVNINAGDLFIQGVTFSGYGQSATTAAPDFQLLFVSGQGSGTYRLTLDSVTWSNSGWGTNGTSNASFVATGGGLSSMRQNFFMTDCSEPNRQSGSPGNNFAGCDLYAWNGALVQRCSAASSGGVDEAFMMKSDVQNGCIRECSVNVTGCSYAFSFLQNQTIISQNNESCYNLGIGVGSISLPVTPGYTWGNLWAYRNTLISGSSQGLRSNSSSYNLEAPLILSATPTTGAGSLAAGTYYYKVTSLGVSGESAAIYGGGAAPNVTNAGGGNEISATLSATGEIVLNFSALALASSFNVYRGTSSGSENQYVNVGNVASWTDNGGASWASATPPATSTAVSSARFDFDSNAVQTTYTPLPPTGATITADGNNVIDSAGTIIQANGQLNPSYSGYSSIYGKVGYQIA